MTSKLAQNSDSSNHNNIINYGEYLCEEKEFKLRMVIDEALNDTDNLEKYIAKDGNIYLDHENSASISYTGDVKFITE